MIMAFLPKAATPFTFQLSAPWSPRGKSASARKGFPGPVIRIIPDEVRGQPKTESFVAREPTSPAISCIGRVKNKKRKNIISKSKIVLPPVQEAKPISSTRDEKKRPPSMTNIFKETKQDNKARVGEKEPSLGQIKQYASRQGALRDFDWRNNYEENL
ncbi:hypothetical protein Q3G72_027891 [Acer saccharum]|nr:hypothetical protein Q3G72_027891 [Acer saccharum]